MDIVFYFTALSPEFFGGMPAFSISYPSVIAGIVVGLLPVLLAACSPAKKASKVSPLAAVSGNANDLQPVKKAVNTKFFKIETSLGIHHAKASKKNFILMIGSFSVSIILFLAFSVTIDFMSHTLTPLQPWTADISVISPENTCSVKAEYIEELRQNSAVKNVYGRMFAYNVPVIVKGEKKLLTLFPMKICNSIGLRIISYLAAWKKYKVKIIQDLSSLIHKTTLRQVLSLP